MQHVPSEFQEGFSEMYTKTTPWELGRPQNAFVEVAGAIEGPVLDSGCGTGNTSIFLAERGLDVTGIDFVAAAIEKAREKAVLRGVQVRFLVKDAMALEVWNERFASVIDSGLYHIYDTGLRQAYVRGLAHVLQPKGKLYLLSFTDNATTFKGGVSEADLRQDFAEGWVIESLRQVQGELNPAFTTQQPDAFPNGNPPMWFAVICKR